MTTQSEHIVEGWFQGGDEPALLGQRCDVCATAIFPSGRDHVSESVVLVASVFYRSPLDGEARCGVTPTRTTSRPLPT
jgi:hypothetical protein